METLELKHGLGQAGQERQEKQKKQEKQKSGQVQRKAGVAQSWRAGLRFSVSLRTLLCMARIPTTGPWRTSWWQGSCRDDRQTRRTRSGTTGKGHHQPHATRHTPPPTIQRCKLVLLYHTVHTWLNYVPHTVRRTIVSSHVFSPRDPLRRTASVPGMTSR